MLAPALRGFLQTVPEVGGKRTKILYRPSRARVKVPYLIVPKLQAPKQAFCPSACIPDALFLGKTHFQVLEPHFQPDRKGLWFLIILFASVQSERGGCVRQRSQRRRWQGAPASSVVLKKKTLHLLLFCKSLQVHPQQPPGHLFMTGIVNDFHPRPPLKLDMLQPHLYNFVQKSWALRARGWSGPSGLPRCLGGFGNGHLSEREGSWPLGTHQPLNSLLSIL